MNLDEVTNANVGQEIGMTAPWDERIFEALRTRGHWKPLEFIIKWFSIAGNWGLFWVALAAGIWQSGVGLGRAADAIQIGGGGNQHGIEGRDLASEPVGIAQPPGADRQIIALAHHIDQPVLQTHDDVQIGVDLR